MENVNIQKVILNQTALFTGKSKESEKIEMQTASQVQWSSLMTLKKQMTRQEVNDCLLGLL